MTAPSDRDRADQTGARVRNLLAEGRRREKEQALFYRSLAAAASVDDSVDASVGDGGRRADSERLNELHADEQHHLSRLTARLIELGGEPADLRLMEGPETGLDGWEEVARAREQDEVAWYEAMEEEALDPVTRAVVREILESERHHRDELRGKWMPA